MRDQFRCLRQANLDRASLWDTPAKDAAGLSFQSNELAGETGEVCNVVKKLERERFGMVGSTDTVEHLAEELADVIICADLIAMKMGIDLYAAVCQKFNATSRKNNLPVYMPEND